MIKLVIDTSSHICQIAIIKDETILSHVFQEISFGMGEALFGILQKALDQAGIIKQDIDEIYVTLGPGSFTGVRIGISAAIGLKLGLGIPLHGISSLKAHAQQGRSVLPALVILDARRQKDFYVQAFAPDLTPLTEPLNISVEMIREMLSNKAYFVCGDAAQELKDGLFLNCVFDENRFLDPLSIIHTGGQKQVAPLYIRPPDVGIKKWEKS